MEILKSYLQYYEHIPYLLKTDDDMYINIRDTHLDLSQTTMDGIGMILYHILKAM